MKNLNQKITLLIGTAVLAMGLTAIPAMAATQNQTSPSQEPSNPSSAWTMPYGYGMMGGLGGYRSDSNSSNNSNGPGYGYEPGYGYGMMGGYGGYGMMSGYGGYGM